MDQLVRTVPNLVSARYAHATLRLQGRRHAVLPLFKEIFLPFQERRTRVNEALKGSSPGFVSYSHLLGIGFRSLSPLTNIITSFLPNAAARGVLSHLLGTIIFHPWQARLQHLQAVPPPAPWSSSPFAPLGVLGTLQSQDFYLRSLEPSLLRTAAHYAIQRSQIVERTVNRLWPDPSKANEWKRIIDALLEELVTEQGTLAEEDVQRRIRALYVSRFNKWYTRVCTRTLLEDYVCRTILFPLETVYVRVTCDATNQNISPFFFANAHKIITEEGTAALYSGLSVTMAAIFPHVFCAWAFFVVGRVVIALVDPMMLARWGGFAPELPEEEEDE